MTQEKPKAEVGDSPPARAEKPKVEKAKVSQGSMPQSRQEEHRRRVEGPAKYNGGRP